MAVENPADSGSRQIRNPWEARRPRLAQRLHPVRRDATRVQTAAGHCDFCHRPSVDCGRRVLLAVSQHLRNHRRRPG